MRYLKGLEEEMAQHWIKLAAEEAKNSRCSKSNRGVVIVKDDITLLGKGTNNPPGKVECLTERCYEICNEYAVHAEQNAIIEALRNGKNIEGSRMYHVKVKNDVIKYLEKKEHLEKGNELHPYFERNIRSLTRENNVITDDKIHSLKFKDETTAIVIETRDGYNRVRYTFYANLYFSQNMDVIH